MAFTAAQEATLIQVADAFTRGKKINELSKSTGAIENYTVEVQDHTGESKNVNLLQAINLVNKRIACRRWNETLSTPVGEAYGNIDFLRDLPSVLGLGCYLVTDDRVRRKLDPTNHYKFQDGSPAKLDGTDGQYMWCWNKHYYASWKEGNYLYEAVSTEPIEGKECYCIPEGGTAAIGGGVVDRTNLKLCSIINETAQYRGGGNQTDWDGTYRSQLGKVATSITYRNYSTYARKRGEGWDANWYVAEAVPEYLFRIIFGTRHIQTAVNAEKDANGLYQGGLGAGVTNMPDWNDYNGYNPVVPCSAGVELGDGCGEATYNIMNADGTVRYAAKVPVFFGLKNLYGHIYRIVRGIIINAGADKTEGYVAPSLYASYNDASLDGMIKACELPRSEGYIKRVSMNKLAMLPTEVGASASTYFADYFYTNAASSQGFRCRLAGSNALAGANAGSSYTNSYNAVTHASANVSAPLCYFKEDPVIN